MPRDFDHETVLHRLGITVFARNGAGNFSAVGALPDWWPMYAVGTTDGRSLPIESDAFLANFLVDAESFWADAANPNAWLASGPWDPSNSPADDFILEAMATVIDAQPLLLLRNTSTLSDLAAQFLQTGRSSRLESIREATRRDQLELELMAAKEMAERLNRAKSAFLGNVSHEMRTPLTGIVGICELLSAVALPPEHQQRLSELRQAAETLHTTVEKILDLAELETEKISIQREPFDIRRFVANLLRTYRSAALERGLRLQVKLHDQLPSLIVGDERRMRTILDSLLDNALRYTDRGQVTLSVQPAEDGRFAFSIRDTGIGISPKQQQRVLNSFSQVDSSDGRFKGGLGLGLAIAHRLALALGGEMTMQSELGEGSEFCLLLPISAQPVVTINQKVIDSTDPPERLRILVAEDNRINRRFIVHILDRAGHEVTEAENGRLAIQYLATQPFDMVLMDCHMPEMSGYETTIEIRRQESHTGGYLPIVAVTANATRENQQRCKSAGMDFFVAKPFRREQLLEVIQLASRRGFQPERQPGPK